MQLSASIPVQPAISGRGDPDVFASMTSVAHDTDTSVGRSAAGSDAELVRQSRRGQPQAFAALYMAHVGAVRWAIQDYVRDPDAVADAVQDTFVRALARLDQLRNPELFRSWLLSIARRAAIDQWRARCRQQLADELPDEVPTDERGPHELAELAELAGLIETGVATLSPRDAAALGMAIHLGFSPAEVGSALGLTVGAAKVVLHRARRRLRAALALQLLTQQPAKGCAEFQELVDDGDIIPANRHLNGCASCLEAARLSCRSR